MSIFRTEDSQARNVRTSEEEFDEQASNDSASDRTLTQRGERLSAEPVQMGNSRTAIFILATVTCQLTSTNGRKPWREKREKEHPTA